MLRLKKYMKPYIFACILAVILLFGQGFSELTLPNLMSDIVNVGIQRSGIEHSSPDALSSDAMQMLSHFFNNTEKNEQEITDKNYTLIDSSSQDYQKYKEKYSYLDDSSKSIYVLNDSLAGTTREELDDIFARASMSFVAAMKDVSEKLGVENSDENAKNDMSAFDVSKIDMSKMYQLVNSPMFNSLFSQSELEDYMNSAKNIDQTILTQVGTAFVKMFYNEIGISISDVQTRYILFVGLKMIGITILGVLCTVMVCLVASRIGAGVARNLRSDVFRKIESFSNNEFDKFSTASLITRTTNDITQVQMLITMGLRMVFFAPIVGIGGIILATQTTTSMTWVIVAAIVVLLLILFVVYKVAMPKFQIIQKLIDRLNLVTRESLSGMMVIRAFGTEKYEEERFDKANQDLTKVNLFVNRVMTFLMPSMMFVMNAVSLLIVWVGAHQIEQANMQIGDMMAFIQYAMMIIMSFLMIAVMFIMIPRAAVSADRIADVLECDLTIKDKDNAKDISGNAEGRIVFDNVSFKYNNAESNVISDISFTAEPGQTTAIIGSTGSGKSTLINLIPRFYDVTEGKITFDGVDIRDLKQHDLRENIGFVPQKGILFSGDIASNLRYGKHDATDDEIKQAAMVAQSEEFIESKPKKYNSPISQGGTNVSGGQKQRLAIARALVKKAPVYIFDDSFSALDFKTDAALRKALKKYTGNSTVIIVAQRISTIMHAEQIIVLDNGRIVGKGTHNELLKNCSTYREIAVSQNSAVEV
ncbi:MAG: ABC transporter ATP-binding protein [Acutalibacteraceae bacterium]